MTLCVRGCNGARFDGTQWNQNSESGKPDPTFSVGARQNILIIKIQ